MEQADNYTFVKGDICDGELVAKLTGQVEAVVHLAAESHVDRSIESADPFIQTNIVGTQTLLNAALAKGVGRYVQVSTDEVYGSLAPEAPAFTEDHPLAPNSPYAASKAAGDLLVRAFVQTHGFPAIITRCSNNYGQFQFPEKLIPLMITNAVEGKPLPVYGDGQQVRDWIHVADHCAGLEAALYQGQPGQIYNFGGRAELANLELLHRLLAALAKVTKKPVADYTGLITFVEDRLGHDRRYAMDFTSTAERLGWQPLMDLDRALLATVLWYLENDGWWRSIKSGEYQAYYERHYGRRAVLG